MRLLKLVLPLLGLLLSGLVWGGDVSLREKIGQMLIIGFEGKKANSHSIIVKAIDNNNIGGVILFDYNYKQKMFDKNIESPEQVRLLNGRLQRFTKLANRKHHRPQLPLLISVDYEGGNVNRLKKEYGFPEVQSAADVAKMSVVEANQHSLLMAKTLQDAKFNLDFSPVLDVNVNPDNPIIGQLDRSFSANPNDVAHFASIYSQRFLQQGVQCAYKHFPGHGSAIADSHLGFVDVSETWQDYELLPYQLLLHDNNACGMVMTAHIVNRQLDESGLPATLSHKILTGLLRQQLKFEGVIITDDMQMKAISEHYGLEKAVTLAINAGADMLIFGNQLTEQAQDPKAIIDIIESKVKSGKISQKRIDEAYQHVMTFKQSIPN